MIETKKGANDSGRKDGNRIASELFAQCFRAYLECSDHVQDVIRDMVNLVNDPETDEEIREAAHATITEALFPSFHDGSLGIDLEAWEKAECRTNAALFRELDREEATFAERLARLMEEKGITQSQLASEIGVGQPAISMMLSRDCRPQRRTVEKIARVLNVSGEELWPGIRDED